MNLQEAKEKIQKCLALSNSPNEHEAKTALLMARRLMALYKLSEADLMKSPSSIEVETRETSITYSRRRDPWMGDLANLIAEKHCCKGCYSNGYRMQTRTIEFLGFSDDLDLCIKAFEYAVYAIRTNIIAKRPTDPVSYAIGFICGLRIAYENQDAECEETALATVTPPEVIDCYNSTVRCFREKPNDRVNVYDIDSYLTGHLDGKGHLTKKIGVSQEALE